MFRRLLYVRALLVVLVVVACDSGDPLGPGDTSFVEQLDLEGFEQSLITEAVQVEVDLIAGGLTAGELAVRDREPSPEERIQSRATSRQGDDVSGSLTLLLGGLEIDYDDQTRFWIHRDDVSRDVFFQELDAALAGGSEPAVVAERPVPDVPQDPDDASFVARDIAIAEAGSPRIRLNVDQDNLDVVEDPRNDEPDAWLTLLGLRIQLRVRDGTTRIESHQHDFEEVEEFEGLVREVDESQGLVVLESGVVLRLTDRSEIVTGDGHLASLGGVSEALAAGWQVVAYGLGGVEGVEPLRLVVLKVGFKVRHEGEADVREFEGVIASVDVQERSLELSDGTGVRLVDATEVLAADEASPADLAGVDAALQAGETVVAWGHGEVEGVEPLRLLADRIVFKLRQSDDADHREFEGMIATVDEAAGSFTFSSGEVVRILDGTEVVAANDHSPSSLGGVAEALTAGRRVLSWGFGEVESTDPLQFAAERVVFKIPVEDFEGPVATVDVTGRTLTLESGWVVRITDTTELLAADGASPSSLQGVQDAFDAGDPVSAWGWGFVEGEDPVRLEGRSVTFQRSAGG